MIEKKYLIVGGASVASLAVGGAGGYLIAKRKFERRLDGLIALEVEKTKKYFNVLLAAARYTNVVASDQSAAEATALDQDVTDDESQDSELTEADKAAIAKGRMALGNAAKALTDYRGFSDKDKPSLEDVVSNNIFSSNGTPKKQLPPRGPGGKFVPKEVAPNAEQTPYIITQEEYLLGEMDFEQKQLRYFKDEDTLIDPEMGDAETVDNGVIGEVNLTLFPDVGEGEVSIICVRNEGLQVDYEIQMVTESLTAYMGLGDDYGDLDDEEAEDDEHARQG